MQHELLDSSRPCQQSWSPPAAQAYTATKLALPPVYCRHSMLSLEGQVLNSTRPTHTAHLFGLQQCLVVGAALVVCPVADDRGQAMQQHQLRHLQQRHMPL